jgi:hypothetical protein
MLRAAAQAVAGGAGAGSASDFGGYVNVSRLVLSLLAEGLKNKDIAKRLYVSLETVKTHLQTIYGKLGARGRVAALNAARAADLIPHA